MGEAATPEILQAWGEAYWFLADLLIAREAITYSRLAAAPGGWNGWRDFAIESTTPESDVIRSFILVPADGGPVMRHRPGQYLTFALDQVPGVGRLKRNYPTFPRWTTLQGAPNQIWLSGDRADASSARIGSCWQHGRKPSAADRPLSLASAGLPLNHPARQPSGDAQSEEAKESQHGPRIP